MSSVPENEEFLQLVSHDLQSPLRNITLLAELIKSGGSSLSSKDLENLDQIGLISKRANELVKGLVRYLRDTSFNERVGSLDIELAVREAINELDALITSSQARVTFGKLPTVRAKPTQIRRLIFHLLENALKFRSSLSPQIRFQAENKGKEWIFSLKDNGAGVDSEKGDRLFRIFQKSTSDRVSASSVGLATCQRIVADHGGRIWFVSKMGKGSTFYFSLPRSPQKKKPD